MRYPIILAVVLLLCSGANAMRAGQDSLIVTDSIGWPGSFADGNAARVAALSDNLETGYIACADDNDPDTAGVGIQNTTLTDSEIDSVSIMWDLAAFNSACDFRADIIVGGTRATGTLRELGLNNYETPEEVFTDVPGGSGWTQAQVNDITVEVLAPDVGFGGAARVRWLYVKVYGPRREAARRRTLLLNQ